MPDFLDAVYQFQSFLYAWVFHQLCCIPSFGITLQCFYREHSIPGVYGFLPPRSRIETVHFAFYRGLWKWYCIYMCVSKPEYNLSRFPNVAKLIGWLLRDNWIWELNLWFVIENGNIKRLQIRPCQHMSRDLFNVLLGEMGQLMIYSQTWHCKRDFKSISRAMTVLSLHGPLHRSWIKSISVSMGRGH